MGRSAGGFRPEADILVTVWRDDGKLLHDEPIEVLSLNLLTRHVVEWHGVEIGEEERRFGCLFIIY